MVGYIFTLSESTTLSDLFFPQPSLLLPSSLFRQMGMMQNAGPYGGPYGQTAGQVMAGQLQNKAAMSNSLAQFNMDKKPQPVQGMAAMVMMFLKMTALTSVLYFISGHLVTLSDSPAFSCCTCIHHPDSLMRSRVHLHTPC